MNPATTQPTDQAPRSAEEQRDRNRRRQLGGAIGIALTLIVGIFYVLTGADPQGLITDPGGAGGPEATWGDGGWWQVYFTDPENAHNRSGLEGSIPAVLIDHIDGAKHSIHIASFEFDLAEVATALVRARERGLEVRWITDDLYGIEADAETGARLFPRLEKAGIEIRDDGRTGLMHDKFWVFDGQIVWTGSTNITANGAFRNNNNVIVIKSADVARIYEREFDEMWSGQFGPTSPSTVEQQWTRVGDTAIEVRFAPEDDAIRQIVSKVERAKKSIRFMAFSFTQDELASALMARADAGLEVAGIFETRASETEYSELSTLYCAGMAVRKDGNPGALHHKVLILDDQIVVTGSLNFSDNADNSNDENVLIVTNPDIAAQYRREFERRWAEATKPDSASIECK